MESNAFSIHFGRYLTQAALLVLLGASSVETRAAAVTEWALWDYNGDGWASDIAIGTVNTPMPPGNSVSSFGFGGETGCVNATDGDRCDPILFDAGAISGNVFTTGFDIPGLGHYSPNTTGSMSADIVGGTLTFSALPFGLIGPDGSTQSSLAPGRAAVFGSEPQPVDFSSLVVEDLVLLNDRQYGVVVRWDHWGPSCLGCFDNVEARIRLEGVMTVVPLPAALWLLMSGIATLASLRWLAATRGGRGARD